MHLSSGVIISLLFYYRVILCGGSLLREKLLPSGEEEALTKFFEESRFMVSGSGLRQIIVIGASNEQLDLTKPLLKDYPYLVGKNAIEIGASRMTIQISLVIYFFTSLTEEHVTKMVSDLSNYDREFVFFAFEGIINDGEIETVLRIAKKKTTNRSLFLHYSKNSVKLYSYSMQADCSMGVEFIMDSMPPFNWARLKYWYDDAGNFKRCRLAIGTTNDRPRMELEKDKNGALRIIGGFEGNLLLILAERMNFTPLIQDFTDSNQVEHDARQEIISKCADSEIGIGIGSIRPKETDTAAVEISDSYKQACLVWCVPRITRSKGSIIVSEFSWYTWILVGLAFLAKLAVERIVRNIHYTNRGRFKKPEITRIILDIMGTTLGNPIVYKPLSMGGNFLLIAYICYSMVITTAYKTSLASIFTVENDESLIVDVEGIIKANLTTGGSEFALRILEDQIGENKFMSDLIKRYVIENNVSKALQQVSNDKNLAYLIPRSDLAYHKKLLLKTGIPMSLEVLRGCVLTYNTVAVVPKGSRLQDDLNKIIRGLVENGMLSYWNENIYEWERMNSISAKSAATANTEEELRKFTRDKFYCIFIIYCLAMIVCILVFLGELVVHKLKVSRGFR